MKLLFIGQFERTEVAEAMSGARAFLDGQGIDYVELNTAKLPDASFVYSGRDPKEVDPSLEGPFDLVIALGGDGTLIHSARLSTVFDIPVLGVNFGHLGFLSNASQDGIVPVIAAALAGDVAVVKRGNLRIDVVYERPDGQPTPPGIILSEAQDNVRTYFAFNEIAIARGAAGHIIDFDFDIDGDRVASMRGDGLVVSSATGSTGYALSAGGPLVAPHFRGMVVVPIAPHTLNSRAVVTEPQDVVEVSLPMKFNQREEVSLFVDGDSIDTGAPVERVIVRTGDVRTRLMKYKMDSFYGQIRRTFFS